MRWITWSGWSYILARTGLHLRLELPRLEELRQAIKVGLGFDVMSLCHLYTRVVHGSRVAIHQMCLIEDYDSLRLEHNPEYDGRRI